MPTDTSGVIPDHAIRRLVTAIEHGPADDEPSLEAELEAACERAHLARRQWDAIQDQIAACRHLTRRQLGLTDDGDEQWDALPYWGVERQTADGFRSFLRRLAATVVSRSDDVSIVAAELHGIVYGEDAAVAPVTWQDYRAVLVGSQGEAGFLDVRAAIDLLRQGVAPAEVSRRVPSIGHRSAESLSLWLGIREWRQESKARAAKVAAEAGWSAAEFRADYNARMDGRDQIGERAARQYLAAARRELEAA